MSLTTWNSTSNSPKTAWSRRWWEVWLRALLPTWWCNPAASDTALPRDAVTPAMQHNSPLLRTEKFITVNLMKTNDQFIFLFLFTFAVSIGFLCLSLCLSLSLFCVCVSAYGPYCLILNKCTYVCKTEHYNLKIVRENCFHSSAVTTRHNWWAFFVQFLNQLNVDGFWEKRWLLLVIDQLNWSSMFAFQLKANTFNISLFSTT